MLIDRPVQVSPPAGHLDVGLIDEPPVTGSVAARPGSLDELEGETLDPPVDGDVVDGDAALVEQFLDIAIGQAVPQVPADSDGDHLPREPEASEHRGRARRHHRTSLPPVTINQCNSAPPRDAQLILGHSRIALTQEIYADVDRESKSIALNRMQGL
jgi:hypothetical protein